MNLVEIHKIEFHPSEKNYVLVLKKVNSRIKIPILIASKEAQSLSLAYEGINLPRPTTHDLIINLINKFDAQLKSVLIKKYEKGTFYSVIKIKKEDFDLEIDSRPSDAITIALKNNLPIYVNKEVIQLSQNKNIIRKQNSEQTKPIYSNKNIESNYNLEDIIDNLIDALNKAINEENYEIAAKLRDRIKNLKTKKI